MSLTRVVRARPGLQRDTEGNDRTRIGLLKSAPLGPPDAKALFEAKYRGIREAWARYDKQGIVVFAFDERDDPIGELWLESSFDKTRAGIIGRHSMCDLMVPRDHTGVSLRHLVVLTRALGPDEVRTRLIDLATGVAFMDEAGRTLQAVTTEGPLFVRTATADLMILPTPERNLPDAASDAYGCLPERVFFDEIEGLAAPRPRHVIDLPGDLAEFASVTSNQTIVRARGGPVVTAKELCREEEPPTGWLTLRSGGAATRRAVGDAALARGILIGRYSRCDLGAIPDDTSSELSRVHVLLVKDGDDMLAIDTASTNGTTIGGRMKRIAKLEDGDVVELANDLQVVWNTR